MHRFLRLPLGLVCIALASFLNSAVAAPTIVSVSVTSSEFVIDSDASRGDAGYNRDKIKVQSSVSLDTAGNFRYDYQLLDEDDNLVLLNNGAGGTTTTFRGAPFVQASAGGRVSFELFAPAAQLDLDQDYRVKLLVKKNTPPAIFYVTQAMQEAVGQQFIHFTNTNAADAEVNVRGVIDLIRWTKVWACDTDPANDSFQAEADMTLYRYDDFLAASADVLTVGYQLIYELRESSTGSVVAISGGTSGPGYNMTEFALDGSIQEPSSRSVTRSFSVNPAVQLDPVNETYYLTVSLTHEEESGQPFVIDQTDKESGPKPLLHFNGALFAGGDTIIMESITNDPTSGAVNTGTEWKTLTAVAAGYVEGQATHLVTGTGTYKINLLSDGRAQLVDNTGTFSIAAPAVPDVGAVNNVRFLRSGITFASNGFRAGIRMILPAGMGVYVGPPGQPSNHILESILDAGPRFLNQSLDPAVALINFTTGTPGFSFHIIEESKPIEVVALNMLWNVNTGQFAAGITPPSVDRIRYVRKWEMDALDVAPILVADKEIASNDLYYHHVATPAATPPVWSADVNNTARLDVTLNINPGTFESHFPKGANMTWLAAGQIEIDDDLVVPATSSLPSAEPVTMNYARDCPDAVAAGCGTIGDATVVMDPGANPFYFTRDGGIDVEGSYIISSSRKDVVMGYIDALSGATKVYAHNSDPFSNARFLMSGHFLNGDDYTGDRDDASGRLLNSGFDPTDLDTAERPDSVAYQDGLGDYPGMNYRVDGEASAIDCVSVLGGTATPTYTLNNRSKFYSRLGGVSGILEPTTNPFTDPVLIYGYEFTFTDFGLSFLNSEVHDSITAGSLFIPDPSDFTLAFDPLFFSCLGGLTTAEIDGGTFDDQLSFWNADFTGIAANFQPAIGAECDPSDAYLTLGVQAWASNITTPLNGTLGFKPDGNLITADDGLLEGVDSRLGMPSQVEIAGPNNEVYNFYPAHDAYYENHDHYIASDDPGRINLVGYLDVAFFEDLTCHIRTGAAIDNTIDQIDMMGGWIGGGEIDDATFDLDHHSYPSSASLEDYLDGVDPSYLIHAQQVWLGVVTFDYPLSWSSTTRSFRATEPISDDFLVLTTEHELTYLSADNAELDFGANVRLDIPEINLSNIGVNLVEDTGVLAALQDTITDTVTQALLDGVDGSAELLNDRMDIFYDRVFEEAVDPIVDDLYVQLEAAPSNAAMEAAVDDYLCNRADSVLKILEDLDGAVGQSGTIVDEVDQALAKLQVAIRTVIGQVHVDNVTGEIVIDDPTLTLPEDFVPLVGTTLEEGIFADADGDGYDLAELLAVALIEELAPDVADNLSAVLSAIAGTLADQLEDDLNAQFESAGPTIDQLKSVLMEVHNAIGEIRSAGNLYSEISDKVIASSGDIQNLINDAKVEVNAFLNDIEFEEYSAEEVKEVIRTVIRDKFNASPLIAEVQEILKASIYDLDASMNEAVASAFAEMNGIINKLLDDALPADSALAGLLDDAADISAAGSIDGYATINGDALRTLRLDAALQLKLPDDFEFAGYVEINQLDSFGDDACMFAGEGEYAAEVIMGATDIPVAWTGEGLRFDVSTKFTFDTAMDSKLRGFGGAIEMTQGEIGFEGMAITSLGAAAMFGKDENYIAAQAGLAFDSYELAGGVFFGRACTIDPLLIVDPDVENVLGSAPFTGVYAYGEAQIPIINASCLFSISAKAGVGVFWFEEGNTFGGKMLVGASGRALCAVEIGGEVVLIGAKSGNNYSFFGKGTIFGEVGVCPLCVSFKESVSLTYKNNKWSFDF